MKRCPTCQKDFPDSMRFCQTDGTPLVEPTASAPPDDPFKTVVGQPPPLEDPFKTVVGGSGSAGQPPQENDILQLPEEPADPMKTMVVQTDDWKKAEPSAPEPPKFSEPDLNPPAFGDLTPPPPPRSTGDILGSSGGSSGSSSAEEPPSESPGEPKISDSPFGQPPSGSPFQSPFEQQRASFEPPPSPFDAPSTPPFDAPKPPPFKEPESPFGSGSQQSPFDQSPFSSPGASPQAGGGSDPFASSSPQAEWNPPPAPMQNWQDQNLGANTPFQPPPAAAGQNNTLAVVSLVLGILSFFCLGIFASIPAIIL
ncbi:MAG: hypothetical protein M3384_18960, partial [Acidobacteriota bacterium]|nr:hypothetical protein [Acidobacteriota bacterium]